ncbi:amidohydrolase family protein [Rubinisphaera sp.]|uniref:amidohydrolase family protein n=1 Tax=Rubinisphaera sp. TaxID=2024857 RepID=UPI0025E64148|nr:amidohydrolase family protein [Rubinisphaera sp.]|tara:strand:- start:4295 stop:5239 length:945 start_codon:yes stop_codon:yes gene_type:complete
MMNDLSLSNPISRRSCLQLAALMTTQATLGWADEQKKQTIIDAHVHVWTADTESYPLGPDYDKKDMQPKSFTPEELLTHTRPAGVDKIVLIQMSYYQFDNSYMLDTIAKYPDTFRGVAIIDHEQADAHETMNKLLKQGVTGFRLYANADATSQWLASKTMATMWKTAADTGQAICLLANPDALPNIEKLCRKFPKTTVVVDHFGRIGVDGTICTKDLDNLCQLAQHENVYVKTSAFYALGKKQPPYEDLGPMIKRLRNTFGAKRLMWASDCPFQVENNHTYATSLTLIKDRLGFLTDEDKKWMLYKTADQVYWS